MTQGIKVGRIKYIKKVKHRWIFAFKKMCILKGLNEVLVSESGGL